MPAYDPDLTSGSPYYDDFDESKNYLKVLFKPGFPVQARELTQMQTSLQAQIERFGNHMFKDGTPIFGALCSEQESNYFRINHIDNTTRAALVGTVLTGTGDKVSIKAKVLHQLGQADSVNDPYDILFLEYLSGGGTGANNFTQDDKLFNTTGQVATIKSGATGDVDGLIGVSGSAKVINIDKGIYYLKGFFPIVNSQTVVPFKISTQNEIEKPTATTDASAAGASAGVRLFQFPTSRVGLKTVPKTVDSIDDQTLLDNARGAYNFSAPGADRYQLNPTLTFQEFVKTASSPTDLLKEDDFVEVLRVEDGAVVKKLDRTQYGEIEKTLARRTYDESGNYTVTPFHATVLEHYKRDQYEVDILNATATQFSVGDIVYSAAAGATAEILDETVITSFFGAGITSAQKLTIDMTSGRYAVGQTFEAGVGDSRAEGLVQTVTFKPDGSGVFEAERGGDKDKVAIQVTPGKAYVYGHEFETQSTEIVEMDKARTFDTLVGANVDVNVGNYLLASADNTGLTNDNRSWAKNRFRSYPHSTTPTGTTQAFSLNDLPLTDLKGDYIQINIPHQDGAKGHGHVDMWLPLSATEHNDTYDNILVLDGYSGSTLEANDQAPFVGASSGAYYQATRLTSGRIGDMGSYHNYGPNDGSAPGFTYDINLQKIIFIDNYRSGINYATGPSIPGQEGNGAGVSKPMADVREAITNAGISSGWAGGARGITAALVRQMYFNPGDTKFYVNNYGIVRRFIPAGTVTNRSGSGIVIQTNNSAGYLTDTNTPRPFKMALGSIQQGWVGDHSGGTGEDNILPISYGTSIGSVLNKNVFGLQLKDLYESGDNGYVSNKDFVIGETIFQEQFYATGEGGTTAEINAANIGGCTGAKIDSTKPARLAIGEVIAWIQGANGPILYVENTNGVKFVHTSGITGSDSFGRAPLYGTTGPCFFQHGCSACGTTGASQTDRGYFGGLPGVGAPAGGTGSIGIDQRDFAQIGPIKCLDNVTCSDYAVVNVVGAEEYIQFETEEVTEVIFTDNGAGPEGIQYWTHSPSSTDQADNWSDDYTYQQDVYQFGYNDLYNVPFGSASTNVEANNANYVNKGKVLSWNRNARKLVLEACVGFGKVQKDLGWIFGAMDSPSSGVKASAYGGMGIFSTSAIPGNATESPHYKIVDIEGPYDVTNNNPNNFGQYIEGETLEQLLPQVSNYVLGREFNIGDMVYQPIPGPTGGSGHATGTVVQFTHRDIGTTGDTQDTVLVVHKNQHDGSTGQYYFEVGANAGKLLTGTFTQAGNPQQAGAISSSNNYSLLNAKFSGDLGTGAPSSNLFTTEYPVTIGTGRIKQWRRQNDDKYQVSFFDITMKEMRAGIKFIPSEIKCIYYGYPLSTGGKLFDVHRSTISETTGTKINDSFYNKLFWKVPQGDVVKTVSSLDYRASKEYDVTMSQLPGVGGYQATILTGSSNIRFVGGGNSAAGFAVGGADLGNYTLVRADGHIANLFGDGFTLRTNNNSLSSEGRLTITMAGSTSGSNVEIPQTTSWKLITVVDVNPGETFSLKRSKKLKEETVSLGTADMRIDDQGSQFWVLGKPDIHELKEVIDTGMGASFDVMSKFTFSNGQTDNFYGLGKLYLNKNGITAAGTTGEVLANLANIVTPLQIKYRYFEHSGEGPLVADSYINESPDVANGEIKFTFDDIPVYTSDTDGEVYDLGAVIDFRPTEKTDESGFDNIFIPASGESFNSSYQHYLPRIDKLVITRNKEFKIIKGVPSLQPKNPETVVEAMEIYKFNIPAYTYDAKDVTSKFIENKRFTMKDIGGLEQRIDQIEYYSLLSLLESKTEAMFVTDANGNNRFKNGMIVDGFKGHDVGDVRNNDYNCAIDYDENELRSPFDQNIIDFDIKSQSNFVKTPDNLVHFPYTPDLFITQPFATTSINVNPFSVTNWLGNVKMDPSSDNWVDTKQNPDVRVNLEGENDNWDALGSRAFRTQWNSWQSTWSGRTRSVDSVRSRRSGRTTTTTRRIRTTTSTRQVRTGIQTRIVPERVTRNVGNRVVDLSIIPFMRTRKVIITADNMRPNTRVYPYFDGIDVSEHCYYGESETRVSEGALITDENGAITKSELLYFMIPAGSFRTGERLFRLTDESQNVIANAKTTAESTYSAQGILKTQEAMIVSTRVPRLVRSTVSDSRIITNTNVRDFVSRRVTGSRDPLAQTFLVPVSEFPDGLFIDSVDIYFKKKSDTLPVTVQLRPTVNGFPHSAAVLPMAEVTLNPEDINLSENPSSASESTKTKFKFSSPIYLLPDEYSIVILSNSDDYEVYIAEMGQPQIGTNTPVTEQPVLGSFFKSQNASTWTPDQNVDLMFDIHKCKFTTPSPDYIQFKERKSADATDLDKIYRMDVMQLTSTHLNWPNVNLDFYARFTKNISTETNASATEVPIITNENMFLDETKKVNVSYLNDNESIIIKAQTNGFDEHVSPIIDLDRFSVIAVRNEIEGNKNTVKGSDGYNGELEPSKLESGISGGTDRARYITKQVTLAEGFESRNVRVVLSQFKPTGSDIQVFIKQQAANITAPFETEPYIELTPDDSSFSQNESDYKEVNYSLANDLDEPMGKFAIKIVMYSDGAPVDTSTIPRIKDMRAIALA